MFESDDHLPTQPSPHDLYRDKMPESIGPYRLLEKIGEGGMGEVYLAEQTSPVRRKVAIKVIKLGMSTKQVIARFESERQALALMDHPCIARVLDAGATAQGLPYFAMEYVPGIPITKHCDRYRLSLPERLELFLQVCEGIQHAHQKAIIHRDLKPSNILVTVQDGKAVPKIIDFGIAKAIAQRLTEHTVFTEQGQLIGTPEYMSPEQADATAENVDTRTDVYSLGVLLYELLTGSLPFGPVKLRALGFDEIRRVIREEDPARPSTRVSSLGDDSTDSAKNRKMDSGSLVRQLRGDLDWITMKALEKDRSRRYGSPSDLAADIRRYLTDEPVLATQPSVSYRARKFVRRHRVAVAGASAVMVLLVTLAVTMTIQASRIARERDRANQEARTAGEVSDFLVDLFKVADPMVSKGDQLSAREVLDRGAQRIKERLTEQPLVRARFQLTMGRAYENLGAYAQAEPLYEAALRAQQAQLGSEHDDTLRTLSDLAGLYWRMGRLDQAEGALLKSYQTKVRLRGEDDITTQNAANNLANLYLTKGQYKEAERLYRKSYETRKRLLGPDHPDTLGAANNLSNICLHVGKNDEAMKLIRETLEGRRRVQGEDHPDTLGAAFNLAGILEMQKKDQEAEQIYKRVLERRKVILGMKHPDTLMSMQNLGDFYRTRNRARESLPLLTETLEGREEVLGKDHFDTLSSRLSLGSLCASIGRFSEAERLLTATIDGWSRQVPGSHPKLQESREGLARLFYYQKRYADAERVFLEELQHWREAGAEGRSIADTLFNLACVTALQKKSRESVGYLREAVESGLTDPQAFTDPDLASLTANDEFKALVAQLPVKAE